MLFQIKKEGNVVGVVCCTIKKLKVKVTQTTIKEYLYSHPYYPSLKSVCDAFDKWKIENYALHLDLEEIKGLNNYFIAHRNIGSGQIVLVHQIGKSGVSYSIGENALISEDIETFAKTLSGAVIVFSSTEASGQKDFTLSKQNELLDSLAIPFSILGALLLLIGFVGASDRIIDFRYSWKTAVLIFTKLFGLIVSLLLVLHELKVHNPFVDKICHISKNTDCNAVLNSDSSKIFGWINWADFGFIYFVGGLIFLIIAGEGEDLNLLALVSIISIPYPVFSIYTQTFRIRKFCPLCLTVQMVLIAEFFILLPELIKIEVSLSSVLILLSSYGITGLIYLLVRSVLKVKREYLELQRTYLRFKSSPQIFKGLLLNNENFLEKPKPDRIVLGNPDGDITIHAFLSLYCHPCALAFDRLTKLLENNTEVKINVILIGNNENVTNSLLQEIQNLHSKGLHDEIMELLKEWYRGLKKRDSLRSLVKDANEADDSILKTNQEYFKMHNISGTPTILVENYIYPKDYNINDLEFYIDDIRQLLTGKQKAGGLLAN